MEQTRIAVPRPQAMPDEAIDETREQIIDQIPVTLAWRCGDRLYVRAAKGSPLANRIRSLGARWDREQGGLVLVVSSLDRIKAVLADSAARMAIAADLRAGGGVGIDIPYKANGLRWRAPDARRDLGCNDQDLAGPRGLSPTTPGGAGTVAPTRTA